MKNAETASISNLNYILADVDCLPLLMKVEAKDGFYFTNPEVEEKSVFECGNYTHYDTDGNVMFTDLSTNLFYPYALSSALLKKCNDILNSRNPEEKEDEEEKSEEEKALDKKVKEVLDKWKESNIDNTKLITKNYKYAVATRYYNGKQGDFIANESKLDTLSDEELLAIVAASENMKEFKLTKDEIKNSFPYGNDWLSETIDYTPEGWRQRKMLEYKTKKDLGIISEKEYEEKVKWAKEFDFHPGWNYDKKDTNKIDIKDLKITTKAKEVITDFNKYFAINALNKCNLYKKCEQI